MNKNTKIVCTLGPATDSVTELEKLIQAGMNVARFNFSHDDHKGHKRILKNLRKAEKNIGREIITIQDLQGPKIRIGKVSSEGIEVKRGQKIVLSTIKKEDTIPVQYKNITKDVKKGDSLLIDDGLIELTILKKAGTALHCKVKVGGIIKSNKGINAPTSTISAPAITTKDREDLKFGIKNKFDYVALSFVKTAGDIKKLRKLIPEKGPKIIAKIERREAVENLESIIKSADGIMVARGDLGLEIPAEQVPIAQKRIIKLTNKYGKPVITATQILQSMVTNPRPTRAEISDAANAVFDHTDAIMLSNETAVGQYPFRAAKTLSKVAQTIEKHLAKDHELQTLIHQNSVDLACLQACQIAQEQKADYIIAYTESGYTASHISNHRPYTPIIVVTPNKQTARALRLFWGINQIVISRKLKDAAKILKLVKKTLKIAKGKKAVIIANANKKEKIVTTIKT